jgi:hypothetical protein
MCNPPFYNSFDEARSSIARAASEGHSTGSGVPSELVFETDGEVGFVLTMIKESASTNETRRGSAFYSSMLGKKSSVASLSSFLKGKPLLSESIAERPKFVTVKTIKLGRTCRWVLVWSWQPSSNFLADGWVLNEPSESGDDVGAEGPDEDDGEGSVVDSEGDDYEMEEFTGDAVDEFQSALVDTRSASRKRKLASSSGDARTFKQRILDSGGGGVKQARIGSRVAASLLQRQARPENAKKTTSQAGSNVRVLCIPMDSFQSTDLEPRTVPVNLKTFGVSLATLSPSLKDEVVLRRTRRLAERGEVLPELRHSSIPIVSIAKVSIDQLCTRIDSAIGFCASYFRGKAEVSVESIVNLFQPQDSVTMIKSWDLMYSSTTDSESECGGIMQVQVFLPRAFSSDIVPSALIVSAHLYGADRTSFIHVCDALDREVKQIGRKFRRLEKMKEEMITTDEKKVKMSENGQDI